MAERGIGGDNNLDWVMMDEVEDFISRTEAYAKGELDPDAYRGYRLTRGVYGQRQDDIYMMRVKMPGGIVTPRFARTLAELCDEAPRGYGNITTRTNLQIHNIEMERVPAWKKRLNDVGITQVDACGNAVRTVTLDPMAGLAADEVFDTTPYMAAITRFFLNNPRSRDMPRKFKIALSTSAADRSFAAINDVGLVAVRGDNGEPAFHFRVGGGLASMPLTALELHKAWPARDILTPCLAVIDMFQAHGNRRVRSKARIKHVLRKIGADRFKALYEPFLEKVKLDPPPPVEADTPFWQHEPWSWQAPEDAVSCSTGLTEWALSSVEPTRLADRLFVTLRLDNGGRISGQQLRTLADIVERYTAPQGEHSFRMTIAQNVVLRAVKVDELPALYQDLLAVGLARPGARFTGNVTSCPGTSTCNLGITHSRNAAAIAAEVVAARRDTDLTIKISGCHNSCGQHHIGTLGFYGAVKRIDGRPAPHYRVMVGGGIAPEGATFGKTLPLLPAGRLRECIERLLAAADSRKTGQETAGDWLRGASKGQLQGILADLFPLDDSNAKESDFVDIGLDQPFEIITRAGECAA